MLCLAWLLVSLSASSGVAAQEMECAEFSTVDAAVEEGSRAYEAEGGDELLEALRAAVKRGLACASDDSERAGVYDHFSRALRRNARNAEALEVFEAFERLSPTPADSALWSKMYHRYGYVLLREGRYVEGHRMLVRAYVFAASLPLKKRIPILLAQVDALGRAGAEEASVAVFDRAEEVLEAEGEALDPADRAYFTGWMLWERAMMWTAFARNNSVRREAFYSQAFQDAERAVAVLDRPEPFVVRERIIARLVLAEVLRVLNREGAAMEHVREAVRAADADGNLSLRAEAWMELGISYIAVGDAEAALPPLRKALELSSEIGDEYKEQYSLFYLGRAFERLDRLEEAEEVYREAIARAEERRLKLGTTEKAASGFGEWQEPFRHLAALYLRTDRAAEAFIMLEQTRARHLYDLRRTQENRAHLGSDERARLDSLDAEIERLRSALLVDPDPTSPSALRLVDLITERYGPGANVPEYASPTIAEIQQALAGRGQALISYFLADSSTAFVLTPDAFHAVPLGVSEAAVDSLAQAISPLWRGEANTLSRDAVAYDTGALHALYLALFAPLRDLLQPGTPLVIVPDGPLRDLPFAMLLEEPTPRFQYAGAPFLLRRHPISTDLAAAFLVEHDAREHAWTHDLLAFGRSEFDLPASAPRRSGDGPFPDLPSVQAELGALGRLFRRAVVALDEQASEASLLAQMAGARVIHLASHAAVDDERPLYSRIELWPDSSAGDDGRLHLFELAGRDVPAELVVLSGCSTARGQTLGGEGALGLHYGFRAAGSDASVGTLWYVDDEATGTLMVRFYHHLRAGLSKDRALQQAQLDFLAEAGGMRASPFYWAAPVLYGDAGPLTWSEDPGPSPLTWAGIGALLLLLGLALPRLNVWTYERMEG